MFPPTSLSSPSNNDKNDKSDKNSSTTVTRRKGAAAEASQRVRRELVLPSDQTTPAYECDHCHADISRTVRIRCVECDEFDLCTDCFGTTHTHHKYTVADALNYPLFPVGTAGSAVPYPPPSAVKKPEVQQQQPEADKEMEDSGTTIEPSNDETVDKMKVNEEEEPAPRPPATPPPPSRQPPPPQPPVHLIVPAADDAKSIWTVYEDLKLLRAIQTHGLGNWPDVAEHVGGPRNTASSSNAGAAATKTAKKCMERYLDDFCGRYGEILPALTLLNTTTNSDTEGSSAGTDGDDSQLQAGADAVVTEAERASKRRVSALLRSPGASAAAAANKRYKAVPTKTLPLGNAWQPTTALFGDDDDDATNKQKLLGTEVGRDVSTRAEQVYVRTLATATDPEAVRLEWERTRLNQPGGPTALPMRPDDVPKLPGAQVYGYMPRRGDFDIEWDNDAEEAIADMEFFKHESESDKKLKLRVLQIYSHKLQEREQRKQFILSRRLYDYTARQQELDRLPRDERDLVLRMRMFERYHTVAEHQQFIASLLKAKRLRKRIAKLQMYRRMGIQTLADAERYELDKMRHGGNASAGGSGGLPPPHGTADVVADGEPSYFKQYKTSDRKIRKSVNRGMMPLITTALNTTNTTTPSSQDPAAGGVNPPPPPPPRHASTSRRQCQTKVDKIAGDHGATGRYCNEGRQRG